MSDTATLDPETTNAPETSVPDSAETLASRRASLQQLITEQQAIVDKNVAAVAKIDARGMREELPEFVEAAEEAIKAAKSKIDKAKSHLEGISKQERVAGFAQPFIAKLGTFKTDLGTDRLPTQLHLVNIDKDLNDIETAIVNLNEKRKLLKHVQRGLASFTDVELDDDMPALKTKAVDGGIQFEFASRVGRRARTSSESASPTQARGNYKIVDVTNSAMQDLVGAVVGDLPGAAYVNWQALYLDRAPAEVRAKLDKQSRSKREWFEKFAGATIELIPDTAESADSEAASAS